MIKMKMQTFIKIISFIIAILVVLSVFSVLAWKENMNTRYVLSSSYQKSIAEVAALSETLLSDMQKLEYSKSLYQFLTLVSQIQQAASGIKTAFEQLPGADTELQKTSGLLTVTGDYAYALAKKMLSGDTLSDEEKTNLKTLTDEVSGVCRAFLDAESAVLEENPDAEALSEMFRAAEDTVDDSQPVGGYAKIESDIEALPTLIYDGPFSEGNMNKKSVFLPGKEIISEIKAEELCENLFNISAESLNMSGAVEYAGEACYSFSGGNYNVYVTRAGGYIRYFSNSREIGDASVSFEEAVSKGKGILEKLGYKNMRETYYMESGNVLLVNYAYVQDDVICYPDLIKVGVALDNGETVFIDASNYLLNHSVSRTLEADLSVEEAAAFLNSDYSAGNAKKAVIPTDGGNEVFCYEFLLEGENDALVYINAKTGREENILILLQDENGTLVY